jgi:hypothetical protein
VFEKACLYRSARQTAANHREFNLLSDQEAVAEAEALTAFVKEYKAYHESRAKLGV